MPLAFDFADKQLALGWKATNDLSRAVLTADGLATRSTGGDPYLIGPLISLPAASALHLEIRMRSSKGNDAQVFWGQDGKDFNEAASQHFTVNPDGAWHTYRLDLQNHKAWQGTITRLRLDPSNTSGAEITLASIRALGALPPELNTVSFGPVHAIQSQGQPFELKGEVKNTGDLAAIKVLLKLSLPEGLRLSDGQATEASGQLDAGKTLTQAWELSGEPGIYPVTLLEGSRILRQATVIIASASSPSTLELANDTVRLRFDQQPFGYGVATLEMRSGDSWEVAGRLRSLGRIVYQDAAGGANEQILFAQTARQSPGQLAFEADFTDPGGAAWKSTVIFKLASSNPRDTGGGNPRDTGGGEPWFELSYQLTADRPVKLLSWRGPEYLAGEGTPDFRRSSALFPGLEFLLGDELSSGTDYVNAAASQRFIPHPNKITIPLMSVTRQTLASGLLWDPLQVWDKGSPGAHDRPAALFASPNRWDGQDNHLMGLLVPGMTAGLQENQDRLDQAYALAGGQVLQLNAALFAVPARDPLAPLEVWLDYAGLASGAGLTLPQSTRSIDQVLDLCLKNYTKVTWVPDKKGWHYVLSDPWGPGSDPAIGLHLWLQTLGGSLPAGTVKSWREMVTQSLGSDPAGGQPNPWLYQPALDLHMVRSLSEWQKNLSMPLAKVNDQQPDGSWKFQPAGGNTPLFGQAGDTSNGYTATSALPVLYYARLTGDPRLVAAGLKALAYLEKQTLRPEGAQTWELSLHVPDILASAWVSQSFVEGYRLTGDAHYLDLAQRWALAGLPFIFMWNAPDRPIMRFTTIPVFGASNYTYPWFGRPVMWNGLDYAMGLQALSAQLQAGGVTPIFNWKQLAEGIATAAGQMLPEEGSFLGMYPDAWDTVTGSEAYTWNLTPSYLAQNLLLLKGDPGVQVETRIQALGSQQIHINLPAQILAVAVQGRRLTLKLAYPAGQTVAVLFSGLDSAPGKVLVNGSPAAAAPGWQGLPAGSPGWEFSQGLLLVKVPVNASGQATVEIE